MDIELGYFLSFIEDEFRDFSDIRIRVSPKSGVRRSPDLDQDYDPEANRLHTERGIFVNTRLKEYYFPMDWWQNRQHDKIHSLVETIRQNSRS